MNSAEAEVFVRRMLSVFTKLDATPAEFAAFTSPDYIQYVNGEALDAKAAAAHMLALHATVTSLSITIDRFVSDGRSAATVHFADAAKKSGERIRLKVVAFYVFENDRIKLVDEVTHLVQGGAEDSDLGSRR